MRLKMYMVLVIIRADFIKLTKLLKLIKLIKLLKLINSLNTPCRQ